MVMLRELMSIQSDIILKCFKETFRCFQAKIDRLERDVEDLKPGLNFNGDQLETKISKVDKKMDEIKTSLIGIKSFQGKLVSESTENKRKTVDLEDRNRRINLRTVGVEEGPNETSEKVLKKLKTLINEDLQINEPITIERAHRVGKFENKPRTIICKLLNWQEKENVLARARNLKGKNIFINEDFSEETMRIRKELFAQNSMKICKGSIQPPDRKRNAEYKQCDVKHR
ncbi:uncharacterized protein LOC136074045 [Hydra vulgaris]|uniref:Uncharacterized protein LOC136074045 n=1 Tax=Hydra vulgaris TaxID=6087 RepID=A0ABM4B0V7_HYDVU